MTISNVEPSGILLNDNEKVNWDVIKEEVESIYSNWPSTLIDLNSLNVNQDNLIKFNDNLNQLVITLDGEDRNQSLLKLADLYGLINLYYSEYSDDTIKENVIATKSYIARAYALIESDDKWDEIKQNITNARVQYNNVMNNSLQEGNINSINKSYILLGEMEKNVDSKNKKVFLINYKNLMQELDIIDN